MLRKSLAVNAAGCLQVCNVYNRLFIRFLILTLWQTCIHKTVGFCSLYSYFIISKYFGDDVKVPLMKVIPRRLNLFEPKEHQYRVCVKRRHESGLWTGIKSPWLGKHIKANNEAINALLFKHHSSKLCSQRDEIGNINSNAISRKEFDGVQTILGFLDTYSHVKHEFCIRIREYSAKIRLQSKLTP